MIELLDFFPFNIETGPEFLVFYFFFAAFGLLGTTLLSRAIGDATEKKSGRKVGLPEPHAEPMGFRVAPPEERKRFTIGWLPQPDEHCGIAWMRGGAPAVAETLLAHAIAEGVLTPTEARDVLNVALKPSRSRVATHFFVALASTGSSISAGHARIVAQETAYAYCGELDAELTAASLGRPAAAHRAAQAAAIVGCGVVLAVGVLRAIRGVMLDRAIGLLVFFLLLAGIASMVIVTRKWGSVARRNYLAWLDASTLSLRDDVGSGRRALGADVSLAVAVHGAPRFLAAPLFVPLAAVFYMPVVVQSSASVFGSSDSSSSFGSGSSCSSSSSSCSSSSSSCSSSSSSCSSSSCGGGGGCGG